MSTPAILFFVLIVIIIACFMIWLIYSRRYQRASQNSAFVRTGFGGPKIVMSGGALVFQTLHEVITVNMGTMRLDIARVDNNAVITKDHMRMNVQAEFYVRVKPSLDDIARAAQTLGRKTMNRDALKSLLQGKFVNILHAVAAEMNMAELHQNRGTYVKLVQEAVGDGLAQNGLELESVSISELVQTDRKFFNPQNTFDAEGLMKLTEIIQARAKQRNAIERDTEVAIKEKDLEAERAKLIITKEGEFARLAQEQEISVRQAEQQAQIISQKVENERQAREAELLAKQKVEQIQLQTDLEIEEKRIAKEQAIKEKEIVRQKILDVAETERDKLIEETRIQTGQVIKSSQIAAEQTTQEEQLAKDRELEQKNIENTKYLEQLKIEKDAYLNAKQIELEREVNEAKLIAEQQVDKSRLKLERELQEEKIQKEQLINELEITKDKLLEIAEIDRRQNNELAEMGRLIAVLEKTKEQVLAQTELDEAKVSAIKAEEATQTARELEIAQRQKAIQIIDAEKSVQRETLTITEMAEARKKEAVRKAEAMDIIAGGEAGKIKAIAEAEAAADLVRLKASEERYRVDADGQRAMHEAENVLDPAKSASRIKMAVIKNMAEIVRQSVKPLESIDGIKIIQVDGLPGSAGGGGDSGGKGGEGNLADQLITSALRYRGQAPILDAVLKEVGLAGGSIKGLTAPLDDQDDGDDLDAETGSGETRE